MPAPLRRAVPQKRLYPHLSKRVSALRFASGKSLQVFATEVGISIPRLRDAECHGLATPETLTLLSRALAVSIDDLVGRKAA